MVKICTLFSGSSGNAAFISTEDKEKYRIALGGKNAFNIQTRTNLLIDCGMSGKQTEIAMNSVGETLEDIHGLLITHEHFDHMKGIGVLTRRYNIPVYLAVGTLNLHFITVYGSVYLSTVRYCQIKIAALE